MIPKSIVEFTIKTLEDDLCGIEKLNEINNHRLRDEYDTLLYTNAADAYKVAIKYHKEYLEESYGGFKSTPPKPVPPSNTIISEKFSLNPWKRR